MKQRTSVFMRMQLLLLVLLATSSKVQAQEAYTVYDNVNKEVTFYYDNLKTHIEMENGSPGYLTYSHSQNEYLCV